MKISTVLVVCSSLVVYSCTSPPKEASCSSFNGNLRSDICNHSHALEVLDLYLDKDGDLHNGSYKQSDHDLKHQLHLWHEYGGDPLVIIYLYPRLPSNNDLHNICAAIKKIESHGEHWELSIQAESCSPPNPLLSPNFHADTNQ